MPKPHLKSRQTILQKLSHLLRRFPNLLFFCFLSITILIFYWKAFQGYFQSDEWFYFSQFLPLTKNPFGLLLALYKSIVDAGEISGGGHLTPIYNGLWYLHNFTFGVAYKPYILSSIFFHILNSWLVFVFVLLLTKSRRIGYMASLFFALSYIHFQAVSWVMAFIPTEVSVTFLLAGCIFIIKTLQNYKRKNVFLSGLFFFAALLTKESAVILFLIIPLLIVFYPVKQAKKKDLWMMLVLVGIIYFPYRLFLPMLLGAHHQLIAIDFGLLLFRSITYPLKMIVEVFIPMTWILASVEFLTPYAYPAYAVGKTTRGIEYLTFTQTVGSDMLIYVLGALLLFCLLLILLRLYKKRNRYFLPLLIGVSIIFCSALPLLLVSTYAPWWGYVTFIDSRHIYLASIGGSFVFALVVFYFISRIKSISLQYLVSICFLSIWGVTQYAMLQEQLTKEAKMGTIRLEILRTIQQVVPEKNKRVVIVESETGNYGFAAIPPFQTGLGQILSILFYNKGTLPKDFLSDDSFSKKGPLSESYKEYKGKGFGYFISLNNFLNSKYSFNFPVENLFTFFWDEKNGLVDTSALSREKFITIQTLKSQTKNWKKEQIGIFHYAYPGSFLMTKTKKEEGSMLQVDSLQASNDELTLSLFIKEKTKPFHEYIVDMLNADGIVINHNFSVKNFIRSDGSPITVVIVDSSLGTEYYVPSTTGEYYLLITGEKSNIERLIKTIYQI